VNDPVDQKHAVLFWIITVMRLSDFPVPVSNKGIKE